MTSESTMKNQELSNNPLLSTGGIPPFDRIEAEHVVPAVRHILAEAETALDRLESDYTPDWEGLLKPMTEMEKPFEYGWSPVMHLLSVKNSPELRKAHETVLNEIVTFSLRVRQSPAIYQGLKAISEGEEWSRLSPAQKRVVELTLRRARHAGVGLEGEDRKRFIDIETELSRLSTDFSNHVLDATKAFFLDITDNADTKGWPSSLKQVAAQSFRIANPDYDEEVTPEKGPWRITLDLPAFMPFIQHSRNREQRKEVYLAYITRASDGEWNNMPLIDRILALKAEKAKLLGFNTFAELSLDSKMAPDVAAVDRMFKELSQAAAPFAKREYEEVCQLARESGQNDEIRQWDWAFWSERLREQRFDYTDDDLRPYFQLPNVLNGLFNVVGNLFGVLVEMETGSFPSWHPDVRLFRVRNWDGQLLASFYLDPFTRPQEKRGGAWMGECLNRSVTEGQVRLPVIHICCNGTPPIGDKPPLMSFGEVETLFHEFGHALQGMLTTVDEINVAGVNGVEWDAVELPSQFMENWCYHKPTLIGMTAHIETGEPLPEDLFEKISRARTFQSGNTTMRQLLFGMVDMKLHGQWTPDSGKSPVEIYMDLAGQMSVITPHESDRFLCAFTHIFAGGYSAGYYSYKWAEVLSADAFAAFEAAGLNSPDAIREKGRLFRDTVLALGGSVHPMTIFKRFRGREPSAKALMRHSGFTS